MVLPVPAARLRRLLHVSWELALEGHESAYSVMLMGSVVQIGTRIQGYLAHKKQRPSLGPPYDLRYSPTVGSWEGGVSCDSGTIPKFTWSS